MLDTIHRGVEDTAVNKKTKISDFVNLHYRGGCGGETDNIQKKTPQYIEDL